MKSAFKVQAVGTAFTSLVTALPHQVSKRHYRRSFSFQVDFVRVSDCGFFSLDNERIYYYFSAPTPAASRHIVTYDQL
ncbi:MAG: hypothetical protein BYD32DRAFT_488949 [Podila humilis]|nr:MAG: hypothetical protein BYD32DRAFT_488949 [Podila humilis]